MEYLEFFIRDLSFPPFLHLSYFRLQFNIYLFIFDQIFPSLAISSFSQPLCLLTYSHHFVCVCCWFLLYFMALLDAPGLSCMFSAPVLASTIFPWFLLLESGIRNQDLGSRCAYYYAVSCSQVLLADRERKYSVY